MLRDEVVPVKEVAHADTIAGRLGRVARADTWREIREDRPRTNMGKRIKVLN